VLLLEKYLNNEPVSPSPEIFNLLDVIGHLGMRYAFLERPDADPERQYVEEVDILPFLGKIAQDKRLRDMLKSADCWVFANRLLTCVERAIWKIGRANNMGWEEVMKEAYNIQVHKKYEKLPYPHTILVYPYEIKNRLLVQQSLCNRVRIGRLNRVG